MGVGHLDIGEGLGDAKAFNPSPAIQEYAGMLQQRKVKSDADNKYLNEQLAQVKPDGLRNDADRSNFLANYAKVKQAAIDAENISDPIKKSMEIANVKQRFLDLNTYVDKSKTQGIKEKAWATAYQLNPSAWSDEAIAAHQNSYKSAVDSPNIVDDYTTLARRIDPNKIEQEQKGIEQEHLKNTKWGMPTITNSNVAGRQAAFIQNSRVVDPATLYEDAMHRFDAKGDFEHYIRQSYPDVFANNNPYIAKALAVKQYIDGRGTIAEYSKPEEKVAPIPPKPDNFYAHYNYELANPKVSGTSAASNSPIYRQKWVDDMLSGVPNSGQILMEKLKADPAYNGELKVGKVGDKLYFNIPEKRKWDAKIKDDGGNVIGGWETISPKRQVEVDPKNPNAKVKLNELVNQLTGEKVDISALETPGGKKHIGNTPDNHSSGSKKVIFTNKTGKKLTQYDVEKAASAAGYTVKEYLNEIKKAGIKINE